MPDTADRSTTTPGTPRSVLNIKWEEELDIRGWGGDDRLAALQRHQELSRQAYQYRCEINKLRDFAPPTAEELSTNDITGLCQDPERPIPRLEAEVERLENERQKLRLE